RGMGAPSQYVAYGQGGYGPQKQTSGLAIASLVLAIIGLIIPGLGLVGLVLGIIALTKMRDPQVGGKGLAIGGIAVGAASVLWLGCMISILVPSLGRARETANRVKCASNMRQIGQAILLYSNDNRGAYPRTFTSVQATVVPTWGTQGMPPATGADPFLATSGVSANDVTAALFLLMRTQDIT